MLRINHPQLWRGNKAKKKAPVRRFFVFGRFFMLKKERGGVKVATSIDSISNIMIVTTV